MRRKRSNGALAVVSAVGMIAVISRAHADPAADCNQAGNPDARIRGCTTLLKSGRLTPVDAALALHFRGSAYADKEDFDLALADFDEARKRDPRFPAPIAGMALALDSGRDACARNSDRARQLRVCSALIRFAGDGGLPLRRWALVERGLVYREHGMRDKAIADLKAAIALEAAPATENGREDVERARRALAGLNAR